MGHRSSERRDGFADSWIALVILAALLGGASLAGAGRTPLAIGDAVPDLRVEDIAGEPLRPEDYRGWVQVISVADRESSEQMKLWMADAQVEVTRAHPDLPVAYLTVADVSAVPRFLRGVVRPLLRKSFENSNEELAESYRKIGVEPDSSKVAFRFLPDWNGDLLERFGLEDATEYRCWLAVDGRVVAAFDASTPDVARAYTEAFDALIAAKGDADPAPELSAKPQSE